MPVAATIADTAPTADSFVQAKVQVEITALPPRDRLASMWRDLERRADRSFFLSWSWIGTWLAVIDGRPDLLIARQAGELVGLALVTIRVKKRHRVMSVRTLYVNQTGDDDQDVITIEYNDILADRRMQAMVRRACFGFLVEHGGGDGQETGEVVFGGLDGGLRAEIETLGRPVHERAAVGSARVELNRLRRSRKTFLEGLKPSTRRRIRRSIALYQDRGRLTLHAAENVEEALGFFERCGAFHQARWTARGRPGAFAYPFYVAFHRKLIRTALPQGRVELIEIAIDVDGGAREPIGYLYNFVDRGQVHYYLSGFRFEMDNRLKPGLVSHALCIQRHLENGMDVYDFMGGDQRYKLELGEPGPEIVTLAVQRPNWMLAAERPLRQLKQILEGARLRR